MKRERAKQIIENLNEVRENFDELTGSILEFCQTHQDTRSYSNLVTFVTKLENTKDIISRFRIIDILQIIVRTDIFDYKDFLQTKYLNLFTNIFNVDEMKYLVKCADRDYVWYEVLNRSPKSVGGKLILHGEIGQLGNMHLYAYGIIVDPFMDILQGISKNKDRIVEIKIENNQKKYYVKKAKK